MTCLQTASVLLKDTSTFKEFSRFTQPRIDALPYARLSCESTYVLLFFHFEGLQKSKRPMM